LDHADFDKCGWAFFQNILNIVKQLKQIPPPRLEGAAEGGRRAPGICFQMMHKIMFFRMLGSQTHPYFSDSAFSFCSKDHHLVRDASYHVLSIEDGNPDFYFELNICMLSQSCCDI
jgi:hypothetical protein